MRSSYTTPRLVEVIGKQGLGPWVGYWQRMGGDKDGGEGVRGVRSKDTGRGNSARDERHMIYPCDLISQCILSVVGAYWYNAFCIYRMSFLYVAF
jgi:hypothetical protein